MSAPTTITNRHQSLLKTLAAKTDQVNRVHDDVLATYIAHFFVAGKEDSSMKDAVSGATGVILQATTPKGPDGRVVWTDSDEAKVRSDLLARLPKVVKRLVKSEPIAKAYREAASRDVAQIPKMPCDAKKFCDGLSQFLKMLQAEADSRDKSLDLTSPRSSSPAPGTPEKGAGAMPALKVERPGTQTSDVYTFGDDDEDELRAALSASLTHDNAYPPSGGSPAGSGTSTPSRSPSPSPPSTPRGSRGPSPTRPPGPTSGGSSSGAPKNEPKPIVSPYLLSNKAMARIEEETGKKVRIIASPTKHTHPYLHVMRHYVAEMTLLKHSAFRRKSGTATKVVVDVRGKAATWKHMKFDDLEIHINQVPLVGMDVFRQDDEACHCKPPQSCANCANPLAYITVHGLYYLTKDEVGWYTLNCVNQRFVALVHLFPGNEGELGVIPDSGAEMKWVRQSRISGTKADGTPIVTFDGDIKCSEPSGSHAYRHADIDWIYDGGFYHERSGTSIAIKIEKRVGDLYEVTFAPCPSNLPFCKFEIADAIPKAALPANLLRKFPNAFVAGGMVIFHEKGVEVKFPKTVFDQMVIWWSHKDSSDPKVWQDSTRACGQLLNNSGHADFASMVQAISAAALVAASGGSANVAGYLASQQEVITAGYNVLVRGAMGFSNFTDYIRLFVSAITFVASLLTAKKRSVTSLAFAIAVAWLTAYSPAPGFFGQALSWVKSKWWAMSTFKKLWSGVMPRAQNEAGILADILLRIVGWWISQSERRARRPIGTTTKPSGWFFLENPHLTFSNWNIVKPMLRDLYSPDAAKQYCISATPGECSFVADRCTGEYSLETTRPNTVVKLLPNPPSCYPKTGAITIGVWFYPFVPTVSRSCYHNEVVALRERQLSPCPPADTKLWRLGHNLCKDARLIGKPIWPLFVTYDNVEEWAKRYTGAQRRSFEEAHKEVYFYPDRLVAHKEFTKVETVIKETVLDLEPASWTPRAIMDCNKKYQTLCGPFINAFSKAVKELNPPETTKIAVCYGWRAEDFRTWIECRHQEFSEEMEYYSVDVVKMDKSTPVIALQLNVDTYVDAGCPRDVEATLRANSTVKGTSMHGIKFKTEGGVASGSPTTSIGNCVAIRKVHAVINHRLRTALGIPLVSLLMSDDGGVILPRRFGQGGKGPAAQILIETYRQMGYEITMEVGPIHTMNILSSYFGVSRSGFSFSPKPGKLLSKIFWLVSPASVTQPEAQAYEVAQCILAANPQMPIVAPIMKKVMDLTQHAKNPRVVQRRILKSLKHHLGSSGVDRPSILTDWLHRYGITQAEVLEIEATIASISQLPTCIDHPAMHRMIKYDLGLAPMSIGNRLWDLFTANVDCSSGDPLIIGQQIALWLHRSVPASMQGWAMIPPSWIVNYAAIWLVANLSFVFTSAKKKMGRIRTMCFYGACQILVNAYVMVLKAKGQSVPLWANVLMFLAPLIAGATEERAFGHSLVARCTFHAIEILQTWAVSGVGNVPVMDYFWTIPIYHFLRKYFGWMPPAFVHALYNFGCSTADAEHPLLRWACSRIMFGILYTRYFFFTGLFRLISLGLPGMDEILAIVRDNHHGWVSNLRAMLSGVSPAAPQSIGSVIGGVVSKIITYFTKKDPTPNQPMTDAAIASTTTRLDRKSAQTIKRLLGDRQLSPDGFTWLSNMVDPFSDDKVTPAGYPDAESCNTLVYLDQQTISITRPANVPAGSNWDCAVCTFPITNSTGQCLEYVYGLDETIGDYLWITPTPPNSQLGIINVGSGPVGTDLFRDSATDAPKVQASVNLDRYTGVSRARPVGIGFEVINTTSPINQGGSCTVCRLPAHWDLSNESFCPVSPTYHSGTILTTDYFPNSVNYLLQFGGARQWAAKEGCYVVATMNSTEQPLKYPSNMMWGARGLRGSTAWRASPPTGSTLMVPTWSGATTVNALRSPLNRTISWDMSVAYFTGLTSETTLTINTRVLVEVVPGIDDASLSSLARPSPTYDPLALEMASRAMATMPSGVMLNENPLGEWFRDVVGAAAKLAPQVLGAVPVAGPFLKSAAEFIIPRLEQRRDAGQPTRPKAEKKEHKEKKATPSLVKEVAKAVAKRNGESGLVGAPHPARGSSKR